jgi:hypothetical protein
LQKLKNLIAEPATNSTKQNNRTSQTMNSSAISELYASIKNKTEEQEHRPQTKLVINGAKSYREIVKEINIKKNQLKC